MLQLRKFLPLVLSIGVFTVSGPLPAGPPGKSPPNKASTVQQLETWRKALASGDEAQILAALEEIGQAQEVKACPSIEMLLSRGSSTTVTLKALNLAGQLGQPTSSAAIAPYIAHRTASLRLTALGALVLTKGSIAVATLRTALRGPDPELRGPAALGLGKLGAAESVIDLFTALHKGVPNAAAAVGQLCSVEDCKRLLQLVGKLPFDTLQSGIEPMLVRGNLSDELKVTAVERVRGLQTKSAGEFLKQTLQNWPKKGSLKVRTALEAAVDATRGAVR